MCTAVPQLLKYPQLTLGYNGQLLFFQEGGWPTTRNIPTNTFQLILNTWFRAS